MKAKHLIPNAVTLGNIALGFFGMVAAARGQFERSVVLLFLAALCDLADGKLARALDATSKFGMELDSLSDMVSFGVAPAVLMYLAVLHKLGPVGAVIAVVYPLCGAIRLARFNSDGSAIGKVTFLGCPIPIAASYLWSMVLVRDGLSVWMMAAGTLLVAGAMVSTLKVPKFRKGEGLPTWTMFIGLGAFIAFLVRPMALTWQLWNGWNVTLIVANYVQLARRGHLQAARKERHLKAAA
ncbi:MAG: CDP-diacylglycerol--serine O-phosphatidyltransferase [bacterium]|nr:CDP-diacylglycerol--serine O-phosphatidyltransferase [bacterium]